MPTLHAVRILSLAGLLGGWLVQVPLQAAQNEPAKTWKFSASAAVKELYDDNVFLQSETDLANRGSFVTSLIPQAGLGWTPGDLLRLNLSYAPEMSFFHSEHSEDFFLHRGILNLSGKSETTSYEALGSIVFIDGSSVNPTWTGQGGAPATGAPSIRDRRDATVYRSSLRVTHSFDQWLVRPVATFYHHDFRSLQSSAPGYQNSVDRGEFTAGADLGRKLSDPLVAWAGYRFGMQDQAQLLNYPEEYDSTFHRVLFGLEGAPFKWLKAAIALGPEYRIFEDTVAVGFGSLERWNIFVDASLTFTLSKSDTVIFTAKRFEQPASGGRSTYQDFTLDLNWRHKLDQHWTIGCGGRGYNTEFREPVKRNDWVISASTFVNYAFNAKASLEASYLYEDGQTLTHNASGREFDRQVVALGFKYTFQ